MAHCRLVQACPGHLGQVRSWYGARDVPRGASGEIDGETMLITKTRQIDYAPSDRPPGSVLRRDDGGLLVQCGDRPLLLTDFRPATQKEIEEGASGAAQKHGDDSPNIFVHSAFRSVSSELRSHLPRRTGRDAFR